MKFSVVPVILLTLLVAASSAAMRSWTSANGKYTVMAELVKVEEQSVRLKKEDGEEITVPLDKLSETDQRYVRLRASRQTRSNAESEDASESDAKTASTSKSESPRRRSSRGKARHEDEVAVADEAQALSMRLTRLELPRTPGRDDSLGMIYRATRPQNFYLPVGSGAKSSKFSQVIEKEPKYASANPCRAVAHFGSHAYGFALDSTGAKTPGYGRLYFDLNRNGDLTDDRYVDAEPKMGDSGGNMAQYRFPRVDLTIDVDGAQVDYAFLFSALYMKAKNEEYVSASLNAAAYREAEIRGLGKKKHHVVLVDYNSNGRFDDQFRVDQRGSSLAPVPGDLLLIDPGPASTVDFDLTAGDNRFFLSKLINLGGKFFALNVSPAGDKVELSPTAVEMGYVTSQHPGFRAILYGDNGFLRIGGEKGKGIPLPVGQWNLLCYSVDFGGNAMTSGRGGDATFVAARGTSDCKPLEIVEDKTVDLPFGPPFKPLVRVNGRRGDEVRLGLSIIGAGGEVCTNLLVNGSRPKSPEFVITTSKGEAIERGSFKYG